MQLVKEELRVKNLKGINVPQEAALNLNIFFIERKGLKKFIQTLNLFL